MFSMVSASRSFKNATQFFFSVAPTLSWELDLDISYGVTISRSDCKWRIWCRVGPSGVRVEARESAASFGRGNRDVIHPTGLKKNVTLRKLYKSSYEIIKAWCIRPVFVWNTFWMFIGKLLRKHNQQLHHSTPKELLYQKLHVHTSHWHSRKQKPCQVFWKG